MTGDRPHGEYTEVDQLLFPYIAAPDAPRSVRGLPESDCRRVEGELLRAQ